MKTYIEMINYMKEYGIEELQEPVWIADFFMNVSQGNIIRDLKPIQVFVKKIDIYGNPPLILYRIGKKGQKLKTVISYESGSNGWKTSKTNYFDSEEEAYNFYLKIKEESLTKYTDIVNWHIKHLENLKTSLIEDKKN